MNELKEESHNMFINSIRSINFNESFNWYINNRKNVYTAIRIYTKRLNDYNKRKSMIESLSDISQHSLSRSSYDRLHFFCKRKSYRNSSRKRLCFAYMRNENMERLQPEGTHGVKFYQILAFTVQCGS